MHGQKVFSIFSEEEDEYNNRWRKMRDDFLSPVCLVLKKYSVQPMQISIVGLLMVIPFIWFFPNNPWISLLFLVLNLAFDGLDGSYSRYLHKDSYMGAIVDFVCDHAGFLAIYLVFLSFGLMNIFWAWFYLINYALLLALIIFCRHKRIKFFAVLRSKYYIYGFFVLLVLFGINIFDPLLVFFSVYMIITNFFLIDRIRCYYK